MKRPGSLRSGSGPRRSRAIARGSGPRPAPIDRRRKPRTRSEFARIYGSKARVAWVKRRPCIVAVGVCAGPIENAHVVKGDGGTSYKASAEFIAPMCHRHHRHLHSIGATSFERWYNLDLAAEADACARAWRAHVGAAAA